MQLTIPKQHLNLAATRSQGAISDRALSQIGLKASDTNELKITASDRVLAVYSHLDCDVTTPGTIFIPGKLFADVVKELPEGDVSLKTTESFLTISTLTEARFTMKIPLIDDVAWRNPPELETKNTAEIPTEKLSYLIDQIIFCIEHDSPRNYGSVGYLHKPDSGKLRLVGTDGFRLSYCDAEVSLPEAFLTSGVCLSKRALLEIQRMCHEGHDTISFAISDDETTALARCGGYQIFARLSAVKYPNYRGVLPTANLNPVKLSRPGLQSVTKRVLLAADKTHALHLSFDNQSLTLSSKTMGSSESKEALELLDFRGQPSELAVNGKFLAEVFATLPGDELTMQFKGKEDPVVIIPRDEPAECRSMHVLVPIRENV